MNRRYLLALVLSAGSCFAQSQLPPFQQVDTKNVAVTASAQSLTLPVATSATGLVQYVVTNVGTQTVFFRCDGTTATVNNGMPIGAGVTFIVSLPPATTTCSLIAGSTGSTAYFTVGFGQ